MFKNTWVYSDTKWYYLGASFLVAYRNWTYRPILEALSEIMSLNKINFNFKQTKGHSRQFRYRFRLSLDRDKELQYKNEISHI